MSRWSRTFSCSSKRRYAMEQDSCHSNTAVRHRPPAHSRRGVWRPGPPDPYLHQTGHRPSVFPKNVLIFKPFSSSLRAPFSSLSRSERPGRANTISAIHYLRAECGFQRNVKHQRLFNNRYKIEKESTQKTQNLAPCEILSSKNSPQNRYGIQNETKAAQKNKRCAASSKVRQTGEAPVQISKLKTEEFLAVDQLSVFHHDTQQRLPIGQRSGSNQTYSSSRTLRRQGCGQHGVKRIPCRNGHPNFGRGTRKGKNDIRVGPHDACFDDGCSIGSNICHPGVNGKSNHCTH